MKIKGPLKEDGTQDDLVTADEDPGFMGLYNTSLKHTVEDIKETLKILPVQYIYEIQEELENILETRSQESMLKD